MQAYVNHTSPSRSSLRRSIHSPMMGAKMVPFSTQQPNTYFIEEHHHHHHHQQQPDRETLLYLVREKRWKEFTRRLRQNREGDLIELQRPCPSKCPSVKRYVIHYACQNGISIKAMKQILRVYKDAAKQTDDEGCLPLHYILHYDMCCEKTLEVLLQAYVEAPEIQDNYGCTPIYLAVENGMGVDRKKLEILLRYRSTLKALTIPCARHELRANRRCDEAISTRRHLYANTSSRNDIAYQRRTPLYIMWDSAINLRRKYWWSLHPFQDTKKIAESAWKNEGDMIMKAKMMLLAAFRDDPDPHIGESTEGRYEYETCMLHAILKFHEYLPKKALDFAKEHYSDQVDELDVFGNHPIHHVCSMIEQGDIKRMDVLNYLLAAVGEDAINRALERRNMNGSLPLHLLLSNDDPWDYVSVQRLCPIHCLNVIETRTELYPFELAANSYELDVLYNLFRHQVGCMVTRI